MGTLRDPALKAFAEMRGHRRRTRGSRELDFGRIAEKTNGGEPRWSAVGVCAAGGAPGGSTDGV